MWLLHINQLIPKLLAAASQRIGSTGGVAREYLLYADDIVCIMAHEHRPTLQLAAWEGSEDMQVDLVEGGLETAKEKSGNFLMSPQDDVEGLRRRQHLAKRRAAFQNQNRGDQLEALRLYDSETEAEDIQGEALQAKTRARNKAAAMRSPWP